MTGEDKYKKGDDAMYHEDSGISRVEVLVNNSDGEKIAYRLKVLETI